MSYNLLRCASNSSRITTFDCLSMLPMQGQAAVWLSTSSKSASAVSSLRKIIKPFLIKCHPDMAKQQELSSTAQKINLLAIQNLNSYVDGVATMIEKGKYPFDTRSTDVSKTKNPFVEVDFVLCVRTSSQNATSNPKLKNPGPTTSRRSVELLIPPPSMSTSSVRRHVQRQLCKLLRISGLAESVPRDYDSDEDETYQEGTGEGETHNIEDIWSNNASSGVHRPKTAWEKSRDAFTKRINWDRFDKLYEEAVRDMHANVSTRGLVRDSPTRRRALLAGILQRVRVSDVEEVTTFDRLVITRRLLRILDENFDFLELETFGKYWEELQIVVDGPRQYNTSSSALNKRHKLRKLETGFSLTFHPDNTVTMRIPVDFRDEELLQELDRNVWDFYNYMQQDRGVESVFR